MTRDCPACGRPSWDGSGERPTGELCLPSNCHAWRTEARYDHDDQTWLPVDHEGYDLKGRR
jgi:hypothetical protein